MTTIKPEEGDVYTRKRNRATASIFSLSSSVVDAKESTEDLVSFMLYFAIVFWQKRLSLDTVLTTSCPTTVIDKISKTEMANFNWSKLVSLVMDR